MAKKVDIKTLLNFAIKNNASDLFVATNAVPRVRLNGKLRTVQVSPFSKEEIEKSLKELTDAQHFEEYKNEKEIDFALDYSKNSRFRVNAFNTIKGASVVFRLIPNETPTLEDIRAPEIFKEFALSEKGLVLVTGATGFGKSTTLASMIDYINENSAKHILTIEDPVEFVHENKNCLINHREVGASTKSFSKALRSALRESPDVILVGEMRDLETISLALTAAETGHLVLATLHTSSAPQTINRIIDVFPAGDKPMVRSMLASSLKAVISQKLIPTIDKKSRVAAYEVLVCNPAVKNLIRENQIAQIYSMMQVGAMQGMQTMEKAVEKLALDKIVSFEQFEKIKTIKKSENKKYDFNKLNEQKESFVEEKEDKKELKQEIKEELKEDIIEDIKQNNADDEVKDEVFFEQDEDITSLL